MNAASASTLLKAIPLYALSATAEATALASPLDSAMSYFVDSNWPRAFEELVSLADQGHVEAARIALMMHERSPRLLGGSFPASCAQRSHWLALQYNDAAATAAAFSASATTASKPLWPSSLHA